MQNIHELLQLGYGYKFIYEFSDIFRDLLNFFLVRISSIFKENEILWNFETLLIRQASQELLKTMIKTYHLTLK